MSALLCNSVCGNTLRIILLTAVTTKLREKRAGGGWGVVLDIMHGRSRMTIYLRISITMP